jgi:hypothetical protein
MFGESQISIFYKRLLIIALELLNPGTVEKTKGHPSEWPLFSHANHFPFPKVK